MCGDYSEVGIGGTIPGSGLFRVERVRVAEWPVNATVGNLRFCGYAA
jgi:hypothetical protein